MWNALSHVDPPPLLGSSRAKQPTLEADRVKVKKAPEGLETRPAATIVTACGPPTTSSDKHAANGSENEWNMFLKRRQDTAFRDGAAVLPGFPVREDKSCVFSQADAPQLAVDVDIWNSYWSAFSDRFALNIDDVQEYFMAHSGGCEQQRRVLVAAGLQLESDMELFKHTLIVYASSFGALEHMSRERSIVMLQFTCSRSAEMFAAWAFTLTLKDLFGEACISKQVNADSRLLVRLVSHDNSKVTTTLKLGKNILLPTPFVESLFKGVFDAKNVTYQAGSFFILFETVHAAKTALHSLQRSFSDVFGLVLVFSEEHIACGEKSRIMEKSWH